MPVSVPSEAAVSITPLPLTPCLSMWLASLRLSPHLLVIGWIWKKGTVKYEQTRPVSQLCRRLLSIHCSQRKPSQNIKKLQTIWYLLGINKDRGRVLVHQLVAAVGVNMRHFCAVDVQGHLVLINLCFFRIPGRTLTQGLSEKQDKAGGGVSQ